MYKGVLLFQNWATKIVPFFRTGFSEFLSYIFRDNICNMRLLKIRLMEHFNASK